MTRSFLVIVSIVFGGLLIGWTLQPQSMQAKGGDTPFLAEETDIFESVDSDWVSEHFSDQILDQISQEQPPAEPTTSNSSAGNLSGGNSVSNDACIQCHVGSDEEIVLPSGEVVPVNVDLATLDDSIHGSHLSSNVGCVDCHNPTDYAYPHRPNPAQNLDEFGDILGDGCVECHFTLDEHNPGHLLPQLYDLNDELPGCVDCHGGHDVVPASVLFEEPIAFCQRCHMDYDEPLVADLHTSVYADRFNQPDCQTCHTDNLATVVGVSPELIAASGAEEPFVNSESCQTCHNLLNQEWVFESGESMDLKVEEELVLASVHGLSLMEKEGAEGESYEPLRCLNCHVAEEYAPYPHPAGLPDDFRTYRVDRSQTCEECHPSVFEDSVDGIHGHALADGNMAAATCVDCHGSHHVPQAGVPRQNISHTCAQCHGEINEIYEMSVHGAAMLDGNLDVPVCTDCHGVHDIENPATANFRLRSPQVCAECHADEELMAKYDISTDVFDTYLADFHGSTVTLFEQQHEGQAVNSAVCYDCHGAHNILASNDENSRIIKLNLLETCRDCHPNASANFPDAWTSHYEPSMTHYPVVYLVDLFYKLLIPGVVGGFAVFVGFDAYRMVLNRRKEDDEFLDESEGADEPAGTDEPG